VIPPLAKIHLLGRGPGPLGFWRERVVCSCALSAVIRRLLCTSCFCFFPLHTVPVDRSVVSPAAAATGLFLRGRASTGEVEAHTRDASGCVSAVMLRVPKAFGSLRLQCAFWATYDSTDTCKRQNSVTDCTYDTSDPHATDTMKWGLGACPWRCPGRDGHIAAA
jgi:hypothetical protein